MWINNNNLGSWLWWYWYEGRSGTWKGFIFEQRRRFCPRSPDPDIYLDRKCMTLHLIHVRMKKFHWNFEYCRMPQLRRRQMAKLLLIWCHQDVNRLRLKKAKNLKNSGRHWVAKDSTQPSSLILCQFWNHACSTVSWQLLEGLVLKKSNPSHNRFLFNHTIWYILVKLIECFVAYWKFRILLRMM